MVYLSKLFLILVTFCPRFGGAGFDTKSNQKVKFLYPFFCLDAKEAKDQGQHKWLRLFVQPAPLQHSTAF